MVIIVERLRYTNLAEIRCPAYFWTGALSNIPLL